MIMKLALYMDLSHDDDLDNPKYLTSCLVRRNVTQT